MKAIVAKEGQPLQVEEVNRPVPGDGQVLIKVAAAGLNRADILQRKGMYPPPEGAIDLMGLEVSGRVESVGDGVSGLSVGQEVCALLPSGGYASHAIAHAGSVMPIPEGVSLIEAAGLPETVMTVWANIFQLAALKPDETVLVQGGASGIGTTAIQMVKAFGAKVFVTAGSDEKCAKCAELGADGAFNYKSQDFEQEMTAVGGADVVLDMVGGDYLPKHINLAKPKGRIVHIAIQGGMKGEVNILKVMGKQLNVTGSTLRGRTDAEKAVIADEVVKNVWPWVATGKVKTIVDTVFKMENADAAHARLTSGDHVGKVILDMTDAE